jgi:hypothetical protein
MLPYEAARSRKLAAWGRSAALQVPDLGPHHPEIRPEEEEQDTISPVRQISNLGAAHYINKVAKLRSLFRQR